MVYASDAAGLMKLSPFTEIDFTEIDFSIRWTVAAVHFSCLDPILIFMCNRYLDLFCFVLFQEYLDAFLDFDGPGIGTKPEELLVS
jgi:hypothetical protein